MGMIRDKKWQFLAGSPTVQNTDLRITFWTNLVWNPFIGKLSERCKSTIKFINVDSNILRKLFKISPIFSRVLNLKNQECLVIRVPWNTDSLLQSLHNPCYVESQYQNTVSVKKRLWFEEKSFPRRQMPPEVLGKALGEPNKISLNSTVAFASTDINWKFFSRKRQLPEFNEMLCFWDGHQIQHLVRKSGQEVMHSFHKQQQKVL